MGVFAVEVNRYKIRSFKDQSTAFWDLSFNWCSTYYPEGSGAWAFVKEQNHPNKEKNSKTFTVV